MKKVYLVTLIFLFALGSLSGVALAKDTQNNGKPFQELWTAIENIQLTPGPQGEQGPQGKEGPAGADGAVGPQGEQGKIGPQGDQGVQGKLGDLGPQGEQGKIGPQGEQGPQGKEGPAGTDGLDGAQGEQGKLGPVGPQGPQGKIGDQGVQGKLGPQGDQGVQGKQGKIGPAGADGLDGAQGPQGKIGPAGEPGTISDEQVEWICEVSELLDIDPPGDMECPTPKTVFVTSRVYTGNLGGVAGADEICMNHAESASLSGNFMAWISDGVNAPANRFYQNERPYLLVNGMTVADDWTDLTDGSLDRPINIDEFGNPISTSFRSWTNVHSNGTAVSSSSYNNCVRWTFESPHTYQGYRGEVSATGATWTHLNEARPCFDSPYFKARLYCFEQ